MDIHTHHITLFIGVIFIHRIHGCVINVDNNNKKTVKKNMSEGEGERESEEYCLLGWGFQGSRHIHI